MRIGIMVDATCDLPLAFVEQHGIETLPISVRIDNESFVDHRDPQAALDFYRDHLGVRGHQAETDSLDEAAIHDLFLDQLVLKYDCVFCLTVSASRSPIYQRASAASFAILKDYRPIRADAGMTKPFLMRVIDSRNLFAAQGTTAIEAVRARDEGASPGRLREHLEALADQTWGYVVPRDLYYIRSRARKKGDNSIGLFSVALGSALDIKPILQCYRGETKPVAKARGFEPAAQALLGYATTRVREGLLTPGLCLSYGGDLADLEDLPGYAELARACDDNNVTLYSSVMSITGMVNLGEGALSLGFAAEPHDVKI